MPDYAKGKIYTLRTTNNPYLVYVGSTCQPLSKRFEGHKSATKSGGQKCLHLPAEIINCGGAYIELHEECPCDSREQLRRREGQVMRELNSGNTQIAGRTGKEYRDDNKVMKWQKDHAYYEANKEILCEKKRAYREANKEVIREKDRVYRHAYREANKEIIREKRCAYREANKEILCEKKRVYRILQKAKTAVESP